MKGTKRWLKKVMKHDCIIAKVSKKLPYGSKNVSGKSWCPSCDADHVPHYRTDDVKSKERTKTKIDLRSYLKLERKLK